MLGVSLLVAISLHEHVYLQLIAWGASIICAPFMAEFVYRMMEWGDGSPWWMLPLSLVYHVPVIQGANWSVGKWEGAKAGRQTKPAEVELPKVSGRLISERLRGYAKS